MGVLQPEIDAAVSAGIPVITMDSDAAGSHRLFFVGTNNLEAGRVGGRRLVEKLGGHGNVVFFTLAGQPNIEERLKGFKDVLATRPDIKIVDTIDTKSDARVAFDQAQQLLALTGPKKIDAICVPGVSERQAGVGRDQAGGRDGPGVDCMGREPGHAGWDQGGGDRLDDCAETVHDGLLWAEGAG